MPSRNQLKSYESNAFYHIYNRGAGRMLIFRDEQDYRVFLYYLKIIFAPLECLRDELELIREGIRGSEGGDRRSTYLGILKFNQLTRAIHKSIRLKVYKNVELLMFSLMPNHFHLGIYQREKRGIEKLMRRLATAYSVYFTHKYNYLGPLYQGRYNASHLYHDPELQVLALGYYIENNARKLLVPRASIEKRSQYAPAFQGIHDYPFSSLRYYLAEKQGAGNVPSWLNTKRVLAVFAKIQAHPNGILEERVGAHASYTDFVLSGEGFSLEEVKLTQLSLD